MKKIILFLLLLPVFVQAQTTISGNFYKKKPLPYSSSVTYEGVGAQSSGTTSCTPAYPTVAAGNGLILVIDSKIREAKVIEPDGWEWIDETMDMVESSGSDVGEIRQTMFWKEATGFESGTVSVSCPDCNLLNAVIYRFSKDSNGRWEINTSGGSDITAGTSYSVTSKEKFQSRVNDLLFVVSSINTDLYAYSAQSVTQTGATFSTVNAEIGEYATASGNDSEQFASVFQVTSASVVPAKFVYSATSSGTASGNPLGTTHFVQLRQYFAYQSLPPSGYFRWVAADAIDNSWTGDASTIWDGQRTSITETGDATGGGYDIESFGGRLCFKYSAPLQDASNYWMRAETSKPCPWQPEWPIGSQIIHEIKFQTPASPTSVYREWDFLQCHTGTEPGGPWPLNSPLFYFAFAHSGQAGWNNGTPSGNGQIGIVISTPDPDIRYLTDVTYSANSTYIVRTHVKFGVASTDDTCIKVWISKDGGAMNLVYENYDVDTVFEEDDIATHGAPANVGGVIKTGVYNHLITNGTAAANSIAAGNSGYTLYVPAEFMIVQLPSYFDYITDVTDNSNPLYEWVDTSNY